MIDLMNQVTARRAISPVSVGDNTAQVSQIIDRANFDSLLFLIALGSIGDADTTCTILVEDGNVANLSDAAAVDDNYLSGTEVGAAFQFDSDNGVRKIGYLGRNRYVRLTITPINNTSAALLSAIALLGSARHRPRSDQTA